jgi:hypothetical protein
MVSNFIQSKARSYDPKTDGEAESCAICMEEFTAELGNDVAELNCDSKHIFHTKCIQEWVTKNDICPLCRKSILPDNPTENV